MKYERIDTGWCWCAHKFKEHGGANKPCKFDGCDCQRFLRGSKPNGFITVYMEKECKCPRNPNGTILTYEPDCKRHEYKPFMRMI